MAAEERTEQPTPRRRREAREKGQVAHSVDLSRALGLLLLYLTWHFAGPHLGRKSLELMRAGLQVSVTPDTAPEQLALFLTRLLPAALALLAPSMVAALVGAALGTCTQTRLLVATALLSPDLNRINPFAGCKRLLSWRGLVTTVKGLVKVALVLSLTAWIIRVRAPQILCTGVMGMGELMATTSAIALEIMGKCAALLLILGAGDYAYEWWEHEKSLRMTRQELKRDLREQEGDPQLRGRRRQLRRTMMQQGITSELPRVSVVVTNPVHYAVALRYEAPTMEAPRVVAKGQRALARRIVALAQRWGIPVVHDPPVARALFSMARLGECIPEALYQAVAEILAAVYRKRQERLARSRGGGHW